MTAIAGAANPAASTCSTIVPKVPIDSSCSGSVPQRTNAMGVSALNWAYEVLIIPLPEIYSLFPVLVFTNYQCPDSVSCQMIDDESTCIMQVIIYFTALMVKLGCSR